MNKTDVLQLLSAFGSVADVLTANVAALQEPPGIGDKKARRMWEAFSLPFNGGGGSGSGGGGGSGSGGAAQATLTAELQVAPPPPRAGTKRPLDGGGGGAGKGAWREGEDRGEGGLEG